MIKKELQVVALSKSVSSAENYVIVLQDEDQKKKIPIIIGPSEAQFIGIVLEKLQTKRPLTHSLLHIIMEELGGELQHILISKKVDGIFYTDLSIKNSQGHTLHIDARVSDAIALALKSEVPIFISEELLNSVGSETELYDKSHKTAFNEYSLSQLEMLLKNVLEKEDFESAVRIREAIKKFKGK